MTHIFVYREIKHSDNSLNLNWSDRTVQKTQILDQRWM